MDEWTFETEEQAEAFLKFAHGLPKKYGIVLKSARSAVKVVMNTSLLREMAKAFQFGWMAHERLCEQVKGK